MLKDSLLGFFVVTFFLLCWNPTPIRADDSPEPTHIRENGSHPIHEWPHPTPDIHHDAATPEVIEFGYGQDDPKGPQHWGDLKKEWSLCKEGKRQSPIEIWEKNASKDITSSDDLVVSYKPANATIKNEEHAISVLFEGDAGSIRVNGTDYFLKQCHWHHPSEHIVNGRRHDLELHMVHKTKDMSKVAVIGFLYRLGAPNSFLTKVTSQITSLIGVQKGIPLGVTDPRRVKKAHFQKNMGKPKKAGSKFFRYMGSLTTPPCVEEVIWHLNKKVQSASPAQVELLQDAVFDFARNNARPIQPLNGRGYKLYGDYH
uniref:alpha carbonic anhydrase 7-like n=1 Tax=Fragaria vesca subsp. vesca TaxID=101020 RepID=UPI0005C82A2A|nr:PREDICTED: alpha carbonic anhydrase 7-like [Fragaria vesca subsp. vesca]